MEPISMLFATYLQTLGQTYAERSIDRMNLDLRPQVIEYQGHQIGFQHQMWKIREQSVCANLRSGDYLVYSRCTVAAKQMFNELCQQLAQQGNSSPVVQHRNMYCSAAVSFQPTVATILVPPTQPTELMQLRQRCNTLTAAALGSTNRTRTAERDRICQEYRALQAAQQ